GGSPRARPAVRRLRRTEERRRAGWTPRLRAGRAGQRLAPRAWPRAAACLAVAQGGRECALDPDGPARLLQPRFRERRLLLEPDRHVLSRARLPQLDGRREPPLGLARRRRPARPEDVAREPAAPGQPA